MSINRVTAPVESLVCSVLKTWWPVSAARMAISAVSESRISPTITTSGSWRRMARKPVGESEIAARTHGNLRHARQFVFHRVFDGEDFHLRRVDALQDRNKAWSFCRCRSGPWPEKARAVFPPAATAMPARSASSPSSWAVRTLGALLQQAA